MFAILLFTASFAHATLSINEVMYDAPGGDTDAEWVEVYNPGSGPVDMSDIYIADYDTSWHYHSITPYSQASIPAGGYGIVIRTSSTSIPSIFTTKWPNINVPMFRASFDLGNDTGHIALSSDKKSVYSELSYTSTMGATGDGNSLQSISGSYVAMVATPGAMNGSVNDNSNTGTNNEVDKSSDNTTDTGSGSGSTKVTKVYDNIIAKISAPTIVTTKIGFKVQAQVLGHKREVIDSGKYVWSFGDGRSIQQAVYKPFYYSYDNKGQYVVTLTYYESILSAEPAVRTQVTVTVVDPEVSISSVGDYTDPYIELTNKSNREIDMSSWVIKSDNTSFTMPEGMTILPNKNIRLSSTVTLFTPSDINNLTIYNPTGSLVAIYPDSNKSGYKASNLEYINNIYNKEASYSKSSPVKDKGVIDLDTQTASVNSSGFNNNHMSIVGLLLLIIIGSFVLININKKPSEGELDNINVSDINIIE
jgi:hypothetical protein